MRPVHVEGDVLKRLGKTDPTCDWYAFTPPVDADRVRAIVREMLPADLGGIPWTPVARQRYSAGVGIRSPLTGDVNVIVRSGNYEHPHVIVSGSLADVMLGPIRDAFPKHKVARMDTALDIIRPGAIDAFETFARALHEAGSINDYGLRTSTSKTVYVGKRGNDAFARGYERGLMLRAKSPLGSSVADIPDHWVRYELESAPDSRAKESWAEISPRDAWCVSRVGRLVLGHVTGSPVHRVPVLNREAERMVGMMGGEHMFRQYHRKVGDYSLALGCPARFGHVMLLLTADARGALSLGSVPRWVLDDAPCPCPCGEHDESLRLPQIADYCRVRFGSRRRYERALSDARTDAIVSAVESLSVVPRGPLPRV